MSTSSTTASRATSPTLPRIALVLSAVLLVLAPSALPSSYSWLEHTTSEAGAQEVGGAWMARAGFVLFAIGVAAVVVGCRRRWNTVAIAAHSLFALCMVAVAVFSTRSWIPGAPYDSAEDLVHSIGATTMGFAFVIGVVAVVIGQRRARPLDVVAIIASVLIPAAMVALDSVEGLLQRAMFAVAYAWYWTQTAPDRR